jgi:hypothetical protein
MSSNFIVFSLPPVSALFFLSLERQREKTKPTLAKGQNEAEGGWQGAKAARCVPNGLGFIWRDTGALAEATA